MPEEKRAHRHKDQILVMYGEIKGKLNLILALHTKILGDRIEEPEG
jgi:hypothetical protein